jgi:hypothetical protein
MRIHFTVMLVHKNSELKKSHHFFLILEQEQITLVFKSPSKTF